MRLDPSQKYTGLLVPLFALRSGTDLGIGDTQAAKEMVDWCSRHHISLLQFLPINETGDDNSPYNAISSMALDPTTIAISPEVIPDLPKSTFQELAPDALLKELRAGCVQYRKVKPLKLRLLREAFSNFRKQLDGKGTDRSTRFQKFLAQSENWIADYALFRTLMELHQNLPLWDRWPSEHQDPASARAWILGRSATEKAKLLESVQFFSYVQWIAWEQWSELKTYADARGVALMGDIPFGIGRYSADVWAKRPLFDLYWSCGAPPEAFFKPDLFTERWGQNWGIPLYRWNRMREDSFYWWQARVRGTSHIFDAFRIDHVLGFYRIYAFPWKPEDNHFYTDLNQDQAKQRAGDLPRFFPNSDDDGHNKWLNQQHGEELLRMVKSAAGSTVVVAEDLGMVPDYVRPSLLQLGIAGFKIPLFERNEDGSYKKSEEYPPLSIATLATHDHEPVAAFWQRWNSEKSPERQHLLDWIGWKKSPPTTLTPDLHAAICGKLLSSPSWLVIFMITDLFGQNQRFNVPGPMSDSNWTERLSGTVSELDKNPDIVAKVRAVENLIQETGRK